MITQHRIERLIMNDTPIRPQQGIFAMLRNEHDETVPVFSNSLSSEQGDTTDSFPNPSFGGVVEFQQSDQSSLFSATSSDDDNFTAMSAVSTGNKNNEGSNDNRNEEMYPELDWEALDRKNAYRKKFGLKPLTPEEFMENEALVKQMDRQQQQRAASSASAAEMTKQSKSRQQGFLERLFGDVIPESCESNFDCERPEICCDFGFKKICCASGTMVGDRRLDPALVPVPVENYPPGQEPPTF
jgi:hypothetical protein